MSTSYHQAILKRLQGISGMGQPMQGATPDFNPAVIKAADQAGKRQSKIDSIGASLSNPVEMPKFQYQASPTAGQSTLRNKLGNGAQVNVVQPAARQQSTPNAIPNQAPGAQVNLTASKGGTDASAFIGAISSKESGGNYKAVNKHSGALGKYQIMPANIASWSKAALGKSISTQEFLSNPDLQEKVAQHKLGEYFSKYGAAGAAVAWYAGEGNAKKYVANGGKGYDKKQGGGLYPSVNSYAQDIVKRMQGR